jgi:hypothetical protein
MHIGNCSNYQYTEEHQHQLKQACYFHAMSTARPWSVNKLSSTRPDSGPSRPYTRQTSASRLWTAQSRPGTARPQTAASTMHDASYVIALIESRGIAHEVGMAALDKDTGRVMLIQVRARLLLIHGNKHAN